MSSQMGSWTFEPGIYSETFHLERIESGGKLECKTCSRVRDLLWRTPEGTFCSYDLPEKYNLECLYCGSTIQHGYAIKEDAQGFRCEYCRRAGFTKELKERGETK